MFKRFGEPIRGQPRSHWRSSCEMVMVAWLRGKEVVKWSNLEDEREGDFWFMDLARVEVLLLR